MSSAFGPLAVDAGRLPNTASEAFCSALDSAMPTVRHVRLRERLEGLRRDDTAWEVGRQAGRAMNEAVTLMKNTITLIAGLFRAE